MANEFDWLEIEIRRAHNNAISIHNKPMEERYSSWLSALKRGRVVRSVIKTNICSSCGDKKHYRKGDEYEK